MKVTVLPQNIELDISPDKSLLQGLLDHGIEIRSLCKGGLKCGECRVKITQGEQNALPPTEPEIHLLGNNFYLDGRRLSCQLYCFGEMTVDISEHQGQDHALKKIRGFRRADQQGASSAVQGIMLLDQDKKS